jgi:hypothetical protein
MNPVERTLYDEVTHLMDRLAASIPEGSLKRTNATSPHLRARLEEAEAQLAAARASVIEGYGRWRRALEDVENLWALAAWHSAAAEQPGEQSTPLAA